MMKIEQIRATGTQGGELLSRGMPLRTNVVPISSSRLRAATTVSSGAGKGFALGRKGRKAQMRRRITDGFFITAALGTAALLWWSAL